MATDRCESSQLPDEMLLDEPVILFIDDLVARLRMSRSTIERRRREKSFPIPELPPLDKRPRWSIRAVDEFLKSTKGGLTRPGVGRANTGRMRR
jgi:hypothetical protein